MSDQQQQQQQKMTFLQSTFNSVNTLVGVGILSLPFAFAVSGWMVGGCLLVSIMLLTNYTARLLAKCLDYQPQNTLNDDHQEDPIIMPSPTSSYGTIIHPSDVSRSTERQRHISFTASIMDDNAVIEEQLLKTISNDNHHRHSMVDSLNLTSETLFDFNHGQSRDEVSTVSADSLDFKQRSSNNNQQSRQLNTYSDMGEAAFGRRGKIFISIVFTLELFAAIVALIILASDSFHALFPSTPLVAWKVIVVCIVTPSTWFTNLRWLSYTSLLGIITIIQLIFVITFDGLSNDTAPGSLLTPAETFMWPQNAMRAPVAYGLIMAGFAGHAVFPNIYREMQDRRQFPLMLNVTYAVTFVLYASMAAVGYLMFGSGTEDEITKNLASIPAYNSVLNAITIWLVAINPMTKYALTMHPMSTVMEYWLLDHLRQSNDSLEAVPLISDTTSRVQISQSMSIPYSMLRVMIKILLSVLILITAITMPGFERIMSLLGSLFSTTVSCIFPLLCYLKLYRFQLSRVQLILNSSLLLLCMLLAVLGTAWTMLPSTLVEIHSRSL